MELCDGFTRKPWVDGLFLFTKLPRKLAAVFEERSVVPHRVAHQPCNVFHRERVISFHQGLERIAVSLRVANAVWATKSFKSWPNANEFALT